MFSDTVMFYIAPYVHSKYNYQAFWISSNEKYMEVITNYSQQDANFLEFIYFY